ncbi:MAG: CotH kinase family protein [Saprospiraceae bacterium]
MKPLYIFFIIFLFTNVAFGQDKFKISFSETGGKYDETIELTLSGELGSRIFYTVDGTRPSTSSKQYKEPIKIKETTVVRASVYLGSQRGRIYTETYFINENTDYPIISIAIAPEILFDKTTGWFNPGPNANANYPFFGANFWSRNEVGANIEIFETDGKNVFNSRAGVRLFGGMSRVFPQKSLAIACREAYGEPRIRHQIFPDKKQDSYKHLVLRNAGSDWGKTHARDAIITGLLEGIDVSKQAYRPALVFINGMYWGIYNIREKINRHYLEYEFGVNRDSLDLIEHERSVKVGGIRHYDQLKQFMATNDLSVVDNYEYVKTQMDVENFMIHHIVQIYIDNQDGGGNIKFWRPQTPNGRWRWILYDTDWGFGLQDEVAYKNNSLLFHTAADGPSWPNPPWSTFMLRKLLENEEFKNAFILKFSDYMNTIFDSNNVIQHINKNQKYLKPEIKRHVEKWDLDYRNWLKHAERMREFARQRPDYMRNFINEKFEVGDLVSVQIEINEGGYINLNNNVDFKGSKLQGQYYNNQPIVIRALPKRGYKFSHWEGVGAVVKERLLKLELDQNAYTLKAVFVPSSTDYTGKIVINEISANNLRSGDWVELYNGTDEVIDLTDWVLRDSKHDFIIPTGKIQPKGYVILCQSMNAFKKVFPDKTNVIGDFSFGLNKSSETLELYSVDNAQIDKVLYELNNMQSAFTLSLKTPEDDNSILTNWDVMMGLGTPGDANPTYIEFLETESKQQQRLLTYGGLMAIFVFGLGMWFWRKRT